jgi:cell division septation protein DedD
VTAPPDACPSCGSATESGQEYCLDCGARLVPVRRFSVVGRAWERRYGRYPGDWIWAPVLLLLVAAGSATAGIVAARDTRTTDAAKTVVAISPVVTAPPARRVTPATTTTTAAPPSTTPKPKPPPTGPIDWPARNGFTIVLASIPARGGGRKDAEAKAKDALGRGLQNVGILTSDRFASLHPGYFVVFSGIYDTLDEAQTAARRATSKYPNAYAREISR